MLDAPPRPGSGPRRGPARGRGWPRPGPATWALIAACTLVEAVLQGAEAGLWGAPGWRLAAYRGGAFAPWLLEAASPHHPVRPWAMWLTHAFVHEGAGHLIGNMALLAALGGRAERRLGAGGALALFALSAAGGAGGFAALGPEGASVVGASGAVHGLIGAWLAWEAMERRAAGLVVAPVLWAAGGVAALNLAVWSAEDGRLAWEAHAGGLATGIAVAWLGARTGSGRSRRRR